MTRAPERPRVGGGGAATSAGIHFQQRLGALFGAWLLAGQRFDRRFNLGDAVPAWMRCETEAPIDDILVATSIGGFVAIQAKTTASLSTDSKSPFGKTISQFVRHWLVCRDGDGLQLWNRPLAADRDRLVLAVGPQAPANLREDLATALRLRAQPGGGALTAAQKRAFDTFSACVAQAWAVATTEAYDQGLPEQLAPLITIFVFDPDEVGQQSILDGLQQVIAAGSNPAIALTALEIVTVEMMSQRGGADRATLRQTLLSRGIALAAPPNYDHDIAALRAHSVAIASALERYEVIEAAEGNRISLVRECQPRIEAAAREGSLLIVGEPGSGKSGVLNALARNLRAAGSDVLELAVDRYSVESLEGLGQDLRLDHALLDVLDAWDGADPAWLVIDALDATRGGKGEGVFRSLIERVLERKGRWRVVASIRTFDLRMGQQFRSLFKGMPPVEGLQEKGFASVRHVRVPSWSDTEFQQLLDAAPTLNAALANASRALRELAIVPFNTRLLSDLIKDGLLSADFSHVASQAQLLHLYWGHRIERHGARARACLTRIANAMVSARALRAPVADADPSMIDILAGEGVIIVGDNDRWIQFRHHLLFDFAAARVLIDPDELVSGALRFTKEQGRGLMLAPALSFVLREIWEDEADRSRFWSAAAIILADKSSDPVIRSAAGRICAEYPEATTDMVVLAKRVVAGDANAVEAFHHASGALAIRLEDHPDTPLKPWVRLLRDVSANLAPVARTVGFLLFRLVGVVADKEERADLGFAARSLLNHTLGLEARRNRVSSMIDLVADTFDTDPDESRELLVRIFDPERLQAHGWEEVPTLCRKIKAVAAADPAFAVTIYRETFGFEVTEAHETRIGDSQILPLTSNARQDYEMARYALSEFVPKFLASHPDQAVVAIVEAANGYVERKHPISPDLADLTLDIEGRTIRLREDWSHIWAHNPDSTYGYDAETLVRKLLEHLRTAERGAAAHLVDRLIGTASLAIFWSRMFMAAATRNDTLIDQLLPMALAEPFLMLPDTKKDAIDVVAKGYGRLSHERRVAFEEGVETFDFSNFTRPDQAREGFARRLFGAIGTDNLATDTARNMIASCVDSSQAGNDQNERLFVIRSYSSPVEPYHWIENLDHDSPVERVLMDAIDATKQSLGIDGASRDGSALSDALDALSTLADTINRTQHHRLLVIAAEGVIGQGLSRIMSLKLVPDKSDIAATERLLALLAVICVSEGPSVEADTESNFERHASWGSPAPRVEAGSAVLDLSLQRPDLYPRLEAVIDAMLMDPHPAVRLETGEHLVRIWDIDRDGFWRRLAARLADEQNLGVLDHLTDGVFSPVLHHDPARTEALAIALLYRFSEQPERQARIRNVLSDKLVILWISHERHAAHSVIDGWIRNTAVYHAELARILMTMRGAFIAGLVEEPKAGDHDLRRRSLALASQIVDSACEGLRAHFGRPESTAEQIAAAGEDAQLLDTACRELYFATGAGHDSSPLSGPINSVHLAVFFEEVTSILHRIGCWATPHTVYYLLQLLEYLLPIDPARSFDLMAHALQSGGQRTGYQFESLGADLLVRMLGIVLADHKEIFEDEERRNALIDCLTIFMDAGWPSARRLLYQLPELIQ
jgi:hypothetical protein